MIGACKIELSDGELLRAYRDADAGGDRAAAEHFAESLILHVRPKIRAVLSQKGAQPSEIDDLCQVILIALFQDPTIKASQDLSGLIAAMARNRIIDSTRSGWEKRRIPWPSSWEKMSDDKPKKKLVFTEEDLIRTAMPPDAASKAAEMRTLLTHALSSLPQDQREVVRRYYIYGYTLQEIAGELSLPLTTLHYRLQKGLAAMRFYLSNHDCGPEDGADLLD